MRNLRDVLGIGIQQGHFRLKNNPDDLSAVRYLHDDVGFRIWRVNGDWHLTQPSEFEYKWEWLHKTIDLINSWADSEIMLSIWGPPNWLKPGAGDPGRALPIFLSPAWDWFWKNQVREVMRLFGWKVDWIGITCETNILGTWQNPEYNASNPASDPEGDPVRFARDVIVPAAEIIHDAGRLVAACGQTLQGESDSKFNRAKRHFKDIRRLTRNPQSLMVDYLDVHIYRDDKPEAVRTDYERLAREVKLETGKPLPPQEMFMSEWGFNEGMKHLNYWKVLWYYLTKFGYDGQDSQCDKIRPVLKWLREDKCPIFKAFYYMGFDDPSNLKLDATNGLIDRAGVPKKSAELMRKALAGETF